MFAWFHVRLALKRLFSSFNMQNRMLIYSFFVYARWHLVLSGLTSLSMECVKSRINSHVNLQVCLVKYQFTVKKSFSMHKNNMVLLTRTFTFWRLITSWQNWPVRTNIDQRHKYHHLTTTLHFTLKMTTYAQVVETSVTINSISKDYLHPDDHAKQITQCQKKSAKKMSWEEPFVLFVSWRQAIPERLATSLTDQRKW